LSSAFPGEVRGTADPSVAPRDDKKGRVVAQQGRLLNRRIFQT
jgi:hypothetical protein